MAILHIVLFKLKKGVTEEQFTQLRKAGEAMVGQVPGLTKFDMGPVLPSTAHRALGYDMAIMTTMETEADVLSYGPHPAHQKVHLIRLAMCDETLVYDMVL